MSHTGKLKIVSYQDAPVALNEESDSWSWIDPWGRRHSPFETRDAAYEAYVAQMDRWREAKAADLLDAQMALEERVTSLERALDQTHGWRIIRALESRLGLSYHVQRDEWWVSDGEAEPLSRRDIGQAIDLAVDLRVLAEARKMLGSSTSTKSQVAASPTQPDTESGSQSFAPPSGSADLVEGV